MSFNCFNKKIRNDFSDPNIPKNNTHKKGEKTTIPSISGLFVSHFMSYIEIAWLVCLENSQSFHTNHACRPILYANLVR